MNHSPQVADAIPAANAFTRLMDAFIEAHDEAQAAVVVDDEGEAVAVACRGSVDPRNHEEMCLLGAHVQIIHRLASSGSALHLSFQTDKTAVVGRHLGDGYLLVIKLERGFLGAFDHPNIVRLCAAIRTEAFG